MTSPSTSDSGVSGCQFPVTTTSTWPVGTFVITSSPSSSNVRAHRASALPPLPLDRSTTVPRGEVAESAMSPGHVWLTSMNTSRSSTVWPWVTSAFRSTGAVLVNGIATTPVW